MNGLLTIQDIATMLGVHYNTVYRWIQDRKLPSLQSGYKGVHRIRREDLERFLKGGNGEKET